VNAHQRRPLIIVGAGGHALSVANVAVSAGYVVKHFVDKNKRGTDLIGTRVIGSVDDLDHDDDASFAIGVGDNAVREKTYLEIVAALANPDFPTLVHSTAVVSLHAEVGEGTVLMPHAVVGPNSKIGMLCIINTHASIDHDGVMHDFSSLAPRAVAGGAVTIGVRSAISLASSIKHGVSIGDDSVLGANSYLNSDLPNNIVAYGTPAKHVRSRMVGDAYLD